MLLDLQPWVLLVLVAGLSTGLASASYQLLEMPIRRAPRLAPFGFSALVVGVACSALVAITVVPVVLERRAPPELAVTRAAVTGTAENSDRPVPRGIDFQRYRDDKGVGTHLCTPDDETSCILHEGDTGLHVAVVGDSHARQVASAVLRLAQDHDFTLSADVAGNCPWQLGVYSPKTTDGGAAACMTERKDLYSSVLKDMGVDVVLLSQNSRERPDQILAADGSTISIPEQTALERQTVHQLRAQGIKVVFVQTFLQIQEEGEDHFNPLECLAAAQRVSECRATAPTQPPIFDALFRVLALKAPDDVATIDINPVMCPAWPVCEPLLGRIPVWRDGGHYSADALIKHRTEIWDLLEQSGFFDDAS